MWFLILFSLASCELSPMAMARGSDASSRLDELRDAAMFGENLVTQGEAIATLASLSDPRVDGILADIHSFGNIPKLVSIWAVAARIQRTDSLEELAELAPLARQLPALSRPIQLKVEELPTGDTPELLTLAAEVPTLQSALIPLITQAGAKSVAHAMLTHENTESRRLAAGLLGGMSRGTPGASNSQLNRVPAQIASVYAFDPSAETIPWQGGALYVPGLGWDRAEARTIMGSLIEWHLFCDRQGLNQEQQQIYNNIRSVGLWRQAGYPSFPVQDTAGLLLQWREVIGAKALAELLKKQGVRYDPEYASVLER